MNQERANNFFGTGDIFIAKTVTIFYYPFL